jgi:hypothetical protein
VAHSVTPFPFRPFIWSLEKLRFDKALLSFVEGLSPNGNLYKTATYPFMLSLSKY